MEGKYKYFLLISQCAFLLQTERSFILISEITNKNKFSSVDKNCIKNATNGTLFPTEFLSCCSLQSRKRDRNKSRENSQAAARRNSSIVANYITSAMQLRRFREIYRGEAQQQRVEKGCSCDELMYFPFISRCNEQ